MREVDCLSLVFIDFYVPALTPRLDCIEAALQLSMLAIIPPISQKTPLSTVLPLLRPRD
jgi:hypothetical protein